MKSLFVAAAVILIGGSAEAQVTARRLTERIRPQTQPQSPPPQPAPVIMRQAQPAAPAARVDPAKAQAAKDETLRKRIEFQKKKAEAGLPNAQYDLGMRYWRGDGLDRDTELARKWLHAASTNGLETAGKRLKELDEEIAKSRIKALAAPKTSAPGETAPLPTKP